MTNSEVCMHVIINYYIKPVFFQAEIREQCRKESSTQTLGIQNPRGYKFNWSEKSIHPFVFKWNRFCAWFPLSVLFCCATEEMYNVFFFPGFHQQTSKTWEFQEKFPWAKIDSALFLLIGVLRFLMKTLFNCVPTIIQGF